MKKYALLLAVSVIAIVAMGMIASSISGKEEEREALTATPVVKAEGIEPRSDMWATHFPRQYDSWRQTIKSDKIEDMLKKKPQLAVLWAGYGFAKDYNSPRGHFYAMSSNINSLRTGAPTGPDTGPMPTACWTCKSPDVVRVIAEEGENEFFTGKWARLGDQVVNQIGCADCHDTQTTNLHISREYLKRALEASGVNLDDINHQEMRSLVCAQCHVEYYFRPTEYTDKDGAEKTAKAVVLPWAEGLKAEEQESYYNNYGFVDWTHGISKAPMLKAQHPGYEMFVTGIHYKRGVSCADCHMPYVIEGSVKYSDHSIRNPLDNVENSCLTCHRQTEKEFRELVETKYKRKDQLMDIAMDTLASAHLEAAKAWEVGATEEEMEEVLELIRSGQWLWDYSIASHGSFFHAPEETLRLLGVANETGSQARLKLAGILAKYGVFNYEVPDFSTKEAAQALAGVDLQKEIASKIEFRNTLLKEWNESAIKNGYLNPEIRKGMTDNTSYPK